MMTMMFPLILASIIPSALMLIFFSLSLSSTTQWKDRETSSPFECGFSPVSSARMPFSLRFFLLAVLFLVFDVEIVVLIPSPMIMSTTPITLYLTPLLLFLLIVTLGLLHEWNEGSLDWMH
uniref:NADH-ubiquinone oxidoreductase chain 3 n=1 Tax=Syllis sp. JYC-2022 TaxID=2928755 RepID=A0A976X7K5_9ANNE|nr:NADH dehydrogenase subunit 3 [Syllis sp. JYC-2022]